MSVVTEDWRYRMVTPPKGDYQGVPMNAEARKVADAWDPAADEAAGKQCKSYGAAAIMRVPGRIRITWQDDDTLRLETDAGTQTRLFRFDAPPAGDADVAGRLGRTVGTAGRARRRRTRRPRRCGAAQGGSLKVVTTNLRPGYLRKNGVPYSENAVLPSTSTSLRSANGGQLLGRHDRRRRPEVSDARSSSARIQEAGGRVGAGIRRRARRRGRGGIAVNKISDS